MFTKIKISGSDNIQKESMIQLFNNSLLSKIFKMSDNNYDINILIEDKCVKIISKEKANIRLNTPFRVNDLLKVISDINSVSNTKNILTIQNITVDIKNSIAKKNNKTIDLTEKEIQIILSLFSANNNTLSKRDLLKDVWGYSNQIDTHTLESHIYTLRQKIEDDSKNPRIIITNKNSYKLIKD